MTCGNYTKFKCVYKVLMKHNHSYSLELLSHLSNTFRQFQLVPCAWVHVQSLQSCPTLCHFIDYSPSGSSILGILQAKILECVATPSSRGSSWPRDRTRVSCFVDGFFTHWATWGSPTETLCPTKPKMLSDLGGSVVKNPPAKTGNTRDEGSIPGSGRCPGVGNGNPLQYSCLENPIDRGGYCCYC